MHPLLPRWIVIALTGALAGCGAAPDFANSGMRGRAIRPKAETQKFTSSTFCWPA